jgi:cyclophilin family peptidyl-prolyl cis-trans isomerase/HEAT repeat protein
MAIIAISCDAPAPPPPADRFPDAGLFERMLEAEDARAGAPEQMAPLFEGLANADPAVRRIAVRALGRFERDALITDILPLLQDADSSVRAEATNAIGQAARGGDAARARAGLHERLAIESNPRVRGVIAETLGRLPHDSAADVHATAAAIAVVAERGGVEAADAHLGAARGFFFLARQPAAHPMPAPALAALRTLLTYGRSSEPPGARLGTVARRVRTVAAAALFASTAATRADFETVAADDDPFVRREAAAALATLRDPSRDAIVARMLADSSAVVRYDALRTHARVAGGAACATVHATLTDPAPHVRLLAIDLAPEHCTRTDVSIRLDSMAAALPDAETGWHNAAHAIVALAALDADRARGRLGSFVAHSNPFVRAWAAVAATRLQDVATLRQLSSDAHPNVRTAGITGLTSLRGHAADSVYIAQLEQDDSQLVQAAATALAGSRDPGATSALLRALDRFTGRGRETERDARMALLERIGELGNRSHADALDGYRRDFDPAVARRAATIMGTWTGTPRNAEPTLPTRLPLPSFDELEQMANSRVFLVMASGDTIEIALRPFDAPTNTARFARLARIGYFDGLTFHRIAPNFVVQGGSPNANEYAGDGPFTRDELTIDANWRGTVGLSTRGRDTGDAQIFINLIDNVRLDHDYTVYGEVVRGMDVVDSLLEGAVIGTVIVR